MRRGRADGTMKKWADSVDAIQLCVFVVTLQELELGVLLAERRHAAQGAVLRAWLSAQVLPVGTAVALRYAALHLPDPRPAMDILIAATALVHDRILVARNTAVFKVPGLAVINPWQAVAPLPDSPALPR